MADRSDDQQPSPPSWVRLGVLAAAGTQLGAVLGVSAALGAWLDRLTGFSPWMFLLFVIGGFVGGFWNFLRIVKRYEQKRNDPPDSEKRKNAAGSEGP